MSRQPVGPPRANDERLKPNLKFVALGAVIGLPAALLAAAYLALVHTAEHWLWHTIPASFGSPDPPWVLMLGLPVIGAGIVLAARTLLPGDGGHSPLHGLAVTPTPLSHAPGVALAALGTLAFGAVLGPEAPLIALGAVVGTAVARLARLDTHGVTVLALAGAFSAISALFGGPLVASFMLVEASLMLGSALLPILLPGLVAAAVGYVVFIGLGDWGGIRTAGLAVSGLPHFRSAVLAGAVRRAAGRE